MKKIILALAIIGLGFCSSCEKSKEQLLLVPEKQPHGNWKDWPEYWTPKEIR